MKSPAINDSGLADDIRLLGITGVLAMTPLSRTKELESRIIDALNRPHVQSSDAQDAKRYRWLREYCKTPYDQRCITLLGDTLDEAVDALLEVSQSEVSKLPCWNCPNTPSCAEYGGCQLRNDPTSKGKSET